MPGPRYRAADAALLIVEPLDIFTAVFHRPSGTTHLLNEPAPQILEMLADAPLDVLPIYVRAGAIVAEGALHQYSDDHESDDVVTFHVYGAEAKPDFRAEYTLYEDDGETFAYESGKTSKLYIRAQGQEDALRLTIHYIEDAYVAKRQHLRFTLRQPGFAPSAIEQLERISLDELAEGGIGWSLDESSGDILIQIEDRKLDELVLKV